MKDLASTAGKLLASTVRALQKELGDDFAATAQASAIFSWEGRDYVVSLSPYSDAPTAPAKATKNSFPNSPMPAARENLRLDTRFSNDQIERMKLGFIPYDMSEKWFIYYDGRSREFRFHLSWTGFCLFILKIQRDEEGWRVKESWVNRDPEQHESEDTERDRAIAIWLIDVLLLDKNRDFPTKAYS